MDAAATGELAPYLGRSKSHTRRTQQQSKRPIKQQVE